MHMFWTILSITCFPALHLASDCFYSENIECTCEVSSASCNGFQRNITEVEELLANLSTIYSSSDLLYLHLSIKNLSFTPEFKFSDFKLKNLSIGSELQSIHHDLFSGLGSSLTSLNLQYNKIPFVDNQPFSQLHHLKELKFEYNELSNINSNAFLNLSELEVLSLSGNKLLEVESDLLVYLPAIQELVLSNNNVSLLSIISIESSTLKNLFIQNCSTNGSLTKDFLAGVSNLEHADFSLNQLISVESNAMSALSKLKTLNLSNNMLEKLDQDAFSSLYSLESLDLKSNKLSFITKSSFLNLTNLKYLDLSENKLEAVLSEYTSDLYSLEFINLKNNNIKIIMAGTFSTSTQLQKLFLKGNTWDCICELSYFVSFLTNNSHMIEDINELTCASPASMKGTSLINIDFTPMNCDNKEETEEDYDYDSSETTVGGATGPMSTTNNSTQAYFTTEILSTINSSALLFTNESTTDGGATGPMSTTSNSTQAYFTTEILSTINSSAFLFTDESTSPPTTEIIQTSVAEWEEITNENNQSSSTKEKLIYLPDTEDSSSVTTFSSTQSSTLIVSIIPIKITSPLPKIEDGLTVNILEYKSLGKDFCIRWSMSGLPSDKPTCSVKINSRDGSKSKNLKCPTDGNEIQQCISSNEVYEFCINIYIKAVRKSKACSKMPISTTAKYTTEESSATTTIISTTNQVIPNTTKLFDLTTKQIIHEPDSTERVVFKITKFDVIYNSHNASALSTWTVSKMEPESICKLTLILVVNDYNYTEGVFNCFNNSHKTINIKEQGSFQMCLMLTRNYKSNLLCKLYSGVSYKLEGSRTKDSGYKNSSLIALSCLLAVVALIIIAIVLKKLLKKRIEGDTYNVYEKEQGVQRRMSSRLQQEPCVRYSYTVKEHEEI